MRQRHIACICDRGNSHVMNFAAIGRELQNRGHRFTIFQLPDVEPKAAAEGIDFQALGAGDSIEEEDSSISSFLKHAIRRANVFCREAPQAFQSAGVDGVVVDMTEPGGATAAERVGLPFVTVCNAVPLHSDPAIPPEFLLWPYSDAIWAKARNRLAYSLRDYIVRPLHRVLNLYRRRWGLRLYHTPDDSFSPWAQITQLVQEFDFPRNRLPEMFHYVGPYRRAPRIRTPFPYERLDGKAMIYASLGTELGGRADLWQAILDSSTGLDLQLVISLGGQSGELPLANIPPNTILVKYAPQTDLLARASLAITHAGLNSVMEALTAGVPMIAIPVSNDQFGVAARIAYTQTGEVIRAKKCNAAAISGAVRKILGTPAYRERESVIRAAIQKTRGATAAAHIIEEVVTTRRPVLWPMLGAPRSILP